MPKEFRRDVFQAIADPTRRAILSMIALQAMTPNALAEHFDTSRQAVSRHIKILTECQLIRMESSGRKIYLVAFSCRISLGFSKDWKTKKV